MNVLSVIFGASASAVVILTIMLVVFYRISKQEAYNFGLYIDLMQKQEKRMSRLLEMQEKNTKIMIELMSSKTS